jgi:hypothetical protein
MLNSCVLHRKYMSDRSVVANLVVQDDLGGYDLARGIVSTVISRQSRCRRARRSAIIVSIQF